MNTDFRNCTYRILLQFCLCSTVPATAQEFDIIDLGTLGGDESGALAVNESGQVVGWSYTSGLQTPHGFLWHDGVLTDLGTLGGLTSYALDINDSGQITGYSEKSGPAHFIRAFLWEKGTMTDLGTSGGSQSWGYGINNLGEVTGASETHPLFANAYAFLYTGGKMQDLGGLFGSSDSLAFRVNDFAQCVGNSITGSPRHAALWENGDAIDLGTLGGLNSWAYDINESGQILGFSDTADNTAHHSFIYTLETGEMADLGDMPAFPSNEGTGLNNHGDAVGIAFGEFFGTAAFIYRDGVMSRLQTLLPPGSGWMLSSAFDINDAGMIVGTGTHNGQTRAFLMKPLLCEGDANDDGVIDPLDSGYVQARLGCAVDAGDPACDQADVNGDGQVDPLDVGFVLARFGDCP